MTSPGQLAAPASGGSPPESTTAPRLRDQHGQPWPWLPVRGPEPDAGPVTGHCWLFFLPGAFTPVCTAELGWVDELARRLAPHTVGLRVISCDSAPVLRAVADELGLQVPLLSDFWPHGAAAQAVGEFDAESGRARRSSVLVDSDGRVLSRIRAEAGEPRRLEEHLNPTVSTLR